MQKTAQMHDILIENANKVRKYEFSHFNEAGSGNRPVRKLTGNRMLKRKIQYPRPEHTFDL